MRLFLATACGPHCGRNKGIGTPHYVTESGLYRKRQSLAFWSKWGQNIIEVSIAINSLYNVCLFDLRFRLFGRLAFSYTEVREVIPMIISRNVTVH